MNQQRDGTKVAELILSIVLTLVGANVPIEWKVFLWIVASGIFLHLLLSSGKPKEWFSTRVKWLLIVGIPVAGACALHDQIRDKRISEHSALTTGELIPAAENIPQSSSTNEYPVIALGDEPNGAIVTAPNGKAFGLDSDSVTLKKIDGKVLFSTTVRDKVGNTVVQIEDNRWKVSSSQQQSWDKNYDDNALEVQDGQHRIVLQVRLYRNGVRLQGEWYGSRSLIEEGRVDPVTGIVPLFKYPSDPYWAQRTKSYMP